MINLDKSQTTFSPSVEDADQELQMWFFGIDAANNTNDNYLGLPSFVGKNKKATFQELEGEGLEEITGLERETVLSRWL